MILSFHWAGTFSFFQILRKRLYSILTAVSMSALVASAGISSGPATFPLLRVMMAFLISAFEGLSQLMSSSTPCNYNGNHVLELCAEHNLIITNTFFQHRDTQIYTWYKWNDIDVLSQIDFTLARSRMRCNIRDSRAIPNAGLDTDHWPVITTLVTEKKRKFTKNKKQLERLHMHKFQDEEVQTKIKCTISGKMDRIDPTLLNVDEAWDSFKTALLDTIKEACGTKKTGGRNRKATAW